jgi:hypothetical protein
MSVGPVSTASQAVGDKSKSDARVISEAFGVGRWALGVERWAFGDAAMVQVGSGSSARVV